MNPLSHGKEVTLLNRTWVYSLSRCKLPSVSIFMDLESRPQGAHPHQEVVAVVVIESLLRLFR